MTQTVYGFAEIDMTPLQPVEVAPFRPLPWRKGKLMEGVHDALKCHAMYAAHGEYSIFIVSIDATWVSRILSERIKEYARSKHAVPEAHVVVAATHTHSSPQLLSGCDTYGRLDETYMQFVFEKVAQVLDQARLSAEPGEARPAKCDLTNVPLAVRYRYSWDLSALRKRYLRAADRNKRPDNELRMVEMRNLDGRLLGVVVNMSVHPVFHTGNSISADYPGALRAKLKYLFGEDFPCVFLQGFSGDVRPAYFDSNLFSKVKNTIRHGMGLEFFKPFIDGHVDEFVEQVVKCIKPIRNYSSLNSGNGDVDLIAKCVELRPFDAGGDSAIVLQRMDVPGGISIVAVSGEVFSSYVEVIKQAVADSGRMVLPVGCANGMFGYLPDKDQFEKGEGYELDSWRNFHRPGPLPAGFDEQLTKTLVSLFDQEASDGRGRCTRLS